MTAQTKAGFANLVLLRHMRLTWLVAAMLLVCEALAPAPASAQILGAVGRSAARAATQSAQRQGIRQAAVRQANTNASRAATRRVARSVEQPCAAIPQKCAGLRREAAAQRILASKYPSERVQSETYLLNRNGRRAHDPQTGKARRVDFVLFSREGYTRRYEVTSQHADKRAQLAREQRILTQRRNGARRTGPVYVRDRATGRLVPVKPEPSKLMRFH